jgi:DNA-binding MarR family transcriptional regulator
MRPPTERSLISSFLVGHLELARLIEDRIQDVGLNALEAIAIRAVLINRAVTPGTLREALALRASTASYIVGRLEAKGYAVRVPAAADARFALVRLTGPGESAAAIVSTAITELDAEIASVAQVNSYAVTQVVDAIEALASRERRMRLRHW